MKVSKQIKYRYKILWDGGGGILASSRKILVNTFIYFLKLVSSRTGKHSVLLSAFPRVVCLAGREERGGYFKN